jgi:methylthioribose-1-phosphate isomerase
MLPVATANEDDRLQSMRWKGTYLDLLDQRLLPEQIIYLPLKNAQDVWEAIRHLKVRGAPAIGIAAAYGLYLGVHKFEPDPTLANSDQVHLLMDQITGTAQYLATSRPTAVNLFWALERLKDKANLLSQYERSTTPDQIKQALLEEAQSIQTEDEHTCRMIGEHALTLFHDGMGVLTHCNAGGLATARYGTALAPMYLANEKGIHLRIFADETRPVLQGARLTAFELQQAGIDVTLICDNMAGMIMAKGWIQAVIVGTDRVAANGDIANKIGTYSVAVLARAHGIPFYVACPLSTIDLSTATGADIPIEERDSEEITAGFGKRTAPEGIKVYNPSFDITPNEYVTAIITEKGIIYPPFADHLQQLFNNGVDNS